MTAFTSLFTEHRAGLVYVQFVNADGEGLRLVLLPEQARDLCQTLCTQVLDAVDAARAWTATGCAALQDYANGTAE